MVLPGLCVPLGLQAVLAHPKGALVVAGDEEVPRLLAAAAANGCLGVLVVLMDMLPAFRTAPHLGLLRRLASMPNRSALGAEFSPRKTAVRLFLASPAGLGSRSPL